MAQISLDDEHSALATAAMLRWIHAPIVAPAWLSAVRSFAHQYPAQTLAAWLHDAGLPDGLLHGAAPTDQWGAAVREIFAGWDPDPEAAHEVIQTLGAANADENRVSESLLILLRETPLLMGRVAKAWLGSSSESDRRQSARSKRSLIERLQYLIADVPDESVSTFLLELWDQGELGSEPKSTPLAPFEKQHHEQNQQEELLDAASAAMGAGSGYVESVIGKVLGPLDYDALDYRDQNNAETALNIQPFREVLGLRILGMLNKGA